MTTTTAKLASAKLNDAVGITDQVAEQMFNTLGSKHMAIVELEPFEKTAGIEDANHVVRLRLVHLELAGGDAADHLRDLSRALYTARTPTQVDIDTLDQVEPDADEIIRRGKTLLQCPVCLHPTCDDTINHYTVDADHTCTLTGTGEPYT